MRLAQYTLIALILDLRGINKNIEIIFALSTHSLSLKHGLNLHNRYVKKVQQRIASAALPTGPTNRTVRIDDQLY
jgi:hypothetical protein